MTKLNRVVVTGYGLTSPIGNTPEEFWNSLKAGKIGIGKITKFDTSEYSVHNAAELKDFPFDKYFVKRIQIATIITRSMHSMQLKKRLLMHSWIQRQWIVTVLVLSYQQVSVVFWKLKSKLLV